jgi:hypothetical protein
MAQINKVIKLLTFKSAIYNEFAVFPMGISIEKAPSNENLQWKALSRLIPLETLRIH